MVRALIMRYVAYYDQWADAHVQTASLTVYEPDPELPRKTGLLNKQGVPLYRLPEPKVIGFFEPGKTK